MDNLQIYNAVREVPKEAQKPFANGRFSGTDIKPMWRIKVLTEQFGSCGIGWAYTIDRLWLENCEETKEIAAFAQVTLRIKVNGEWSEGIPGVGGNMFSAATKSGVRSSDECYKMAVTDALSVACKALGVGADVYWEKDPTKYVTAEQQTKNANSITCPKCDGIIESVKMKDGKTMDAKAFLNKYGSCADCARKANA